MPVANINGVDLNYEVTGRGPAVVFLHGMTGSTQDWANQVPILSPNYSVVALDMRGHGKSAAPKAESEYSIPIFTEDVLGLLNLLGINKCCLVGHSIGGFTALQFALSHQDRLAGLVLVDTSSGQFGKEQNSSHRLSLKLIELASSQGVEAAFDYDVCHNPMRIARFENHPELKEIARQRVLRTSVEGYIYGPMAFPKWQPVTLRLSEIKVPTLIYCGEEDAAFAGAVKILEKGIAGSELVTVPGVGHNPHEEAPEIFNQTLLNFLAKVKW